VAKLTRAEVIGAITASAANPNSKGQLALAVRNSLDYLAQDFPGNAVELRVPPFRVVQVLEGVTHRRGTPPAVVEVTPEIWIQLISKKMTWNEALKNGFIQASGEQSDLAKIISDF
jgi:hypothetical protein